MLMMIMMMIVATENLLFGCYAIFCFIDVLLRIKSMMINSWHSWQDDIKNNLK